MEVRGIKEKKRMGSGFWVPDGLPTDCRIIVLSCCVVLCCVVWNECSGGCKKRMNTMMLSAAQLERMDTDLTQFKHIQYYWYG